MPKKNLETFQGNNVFIVIGKKSKQTLFSLTETLHHTVEQLPLCIFTGHFEWDISQNKKLCVFVVVVVVFVLVLVFFCETLSFILIFIYEIVCDKGLRKIIKTKPSIIFSICHLCYSLKLLPEFGIFDLNQG